MWGWLKEVITPVTGMVRGLVTTDKDRLDAVERMQKLSDDFGKKELEYRSEVVKSGNLFTKSVRPVIAYFFLFLYGKHKYEQAFMFNKADYELFLYIVLFYFGLRSSEKLISSFKQRGNE
jgi:hypothetical protein